MKSKVFATLLCFASLLFSSCGKQTVKVKLTGDNYVSFTNSEEIIPINKDYNVQANPRRGYALYIEYLNIEIGGIPAIDPTDYVLNETTQIITIYKKSIRGNIDIKCDAKTEPYKISIFQVVVGTGYNGITSFVDNEKTIENEYSNRDITAESGKTLPPKKDIIVEPEDVNFNYDIIDNKASFSIPAEEFYRDIKITFPDL